MVCRYDLVGDPSTAVVRVTGRLDLLTAAELRARVQQLVAEGWYRLVVDLSDVAYIDSSGLGALINSLRVARHAGGDIRIASAPEPIRNVLQVSMLDQVLTPYPTVEAALAEYVSAA
ncbi:MAG: STAS domain-containing protein [Myxococcota bacterium]